MASIHLQYPCIMRQKILSKSRDSEIAVKTRASTGDHLLSLRTVKVVLVFPFLLYWVANCGVQDTLITQPFNCRGRSSDSITSLISQQGGLICRSIVNDTNAEGRLYPLIYTDLSRAGKRRSSAEFADRPADAKGSL